MRSLPNLRGTSSSMARRSTYIFGQTLLLFVLAVSGCFAGPDDGANCSLDKHCESEVCQGGYCAGSECGFDDDCAADWACTDRGPGVLGAQGNGTCSLACDDSSDCPDSWGCDETGTCSYPPDFELAIDGPVSAVVGEEVQFSLKIVEGPPGEPEVEYWRFTSPAGPDGTQAQADTIYEDRDTISRTFDREGSWSVMLRATSSEGQSEPAVSTVEVTAR